MTGFEIPIALAIAGAAASAYAATSINSQINDSIAAQAAANNERQAQIVNQRNLIEGQTSERAAHEARIKEREGAMAAGTVRAKAAMSGVSSDSGSASQALTQVYLDTSMAKDMVEKQRYQSVKYLNQQSVSQSQQSNYQYQSNADQLSMGIQNPFIAGATGALAGATAGFAIAGGVASIAASSAQAASVAASASSVAATTAAAAPMAAPSIIAAAAPAAATASTAAATAASTAQVAASYGTWASMFGAGTLGLSSLSGLGKIG